MADEETGKTGAIIGAAVLAAALAAGVALSGGDKAYKMDATESAEDKAMVAGGVLHVESTVLAEGGQFDAILCDDAGQCRHHAESFGHDPVLEPCLTKRDAECDAIVVQRMKSGGGK